MPGGYNLRAFCVNTHMRYTDEKIFKRYLTEESTSSPLDLKSFSPANAIAYLRSIFQRKPEILVKTLVQIYKMPGGAKIIASIKSALKLR